MVCVFDTLGSAEHPAAVGNRQGRPVGYGEARGGSAQGHQTSGGGRDGAHCARTDRQRVQVKRLHEVGGLDLRDDDFDVA